MCITQQCANPTLPGVWWCEDDRLCLYSQAHQQQIRGALSAGLRSIDLGTISSAMHPNGARYTVNLDAMEQTALSTGHTRSILVIDPVAALGVQQPSRQHYLQSAVSFQGRPPISLYYRDSSDSLVQYAGLVAQSLWAAVCQGLTHCFVPKDSSRSLYYFFDLKGMIQMFAIFSHGRYVSSAERPVSFLVEVTWNPAEMAALAVCGEKRWRRKVLEMVIGRYGSDNHLEDVLREKARPKAIVRKQVSSAPGEERYEKFLDSLDRTFTRCDPKLLGVVLKNVKNGPLGLDGNLGLLRIAVKPVSSMERNNSFPTETDSVMLFNSMMSPVMNALAAAMTCGMKIAVFLVVMSNSMNTASYGSSQGSHNRFCGHESLEVAQDHCLRLADITVG